MVVKERGQSPSSLKGTVPLTLKIEGARTNWLFGVSPKDAGYPEYIDGRLCHPAIQSADMTFN